MIADDIGRLLAAHPFFAGLEAAQLAVIATLGRTRDLPGGHVVFREGEPATTFDAIVSGRVAVQVHAPQRAPMTVQTIGAGAVLGWSWLFPPFVRRFDAVTLEPVELVELDAAALRATFDDDLLLSHAMCTRLVRVVIERLEATRLQLLDVYGNGARS